jgi:ABC-2 type transport system permease protein
MSTTTFAVPTGTQPSNADRSAPSLLRLVRVELRKAYDTRAGFWLLLVIALASMAVVVLQMLFHNGPDKSFADYFALTQLPVGVLLPVLGILLVTSEWSQRTAMTTFSLVPVRSRVLIAKVLAATVLAVLGVAVASAASAVGTLLTPALTSDSSAWSLAGAHLGQVVLVQVIGVLIGVAFGMALLSSPLAIVLYFVLPTVVTILVTAVAALAWVRDWLDLTTTSAPMYMGALEGEGWLRIATSTGVWLLLPLVVGWIRIERREIG